jgi:hypothetical protein
MAAVGGSIESVILAGRTFSVTADAETQRKLGGFENEVEANGDGTARPLKTRVTLSISGLVVAVDDFRGDDTFLQDLADGLDYFTVAVTYASGATYQGQAQIVGELQVNSQNATAAISLKGPGKLTRQ